MPNIVIIWVSINGGSPKSLIYNGKYIYKWMINGVPPFMENIF